MIISHRPSHSDSQSSSSSVCFIVLYLVAFIGNLPKPHRTGGAAWLAMWGDKIVMPVRCCVLRRVKVSPAQMLASIRRRNSSPCVVWGRGVTPNDCSATPLPPSPLHPGHSKCQNILCRFYPHARPDLAKYRHSFLIFYIL